MYPSLSGDTTLGRFPFTIPPLVKPMNFALPPRSGHGDTEPGGRLRLGAAQAGPCLSGLWQKLCR